ncbi:MAG TPA: L,D-transpeptidase family protein [Jatrophihabitantaceae bacterium]
MTHPATPGSAAPTPTPSVHTSRPSSGHHYRASSSAPKSSSASPRPGSTHAAPHAAKLPLTYPTHGAGQVITVVAPREFDTQATLQAWRAVPGGWRRVGPSLPAWLGTTGMTPQPSESKSATPMGSYTLTQAFGHDSNPGTSLPYTQTTPADWWISEPGPLYNTLQHCSSGCAFTQGDPNEHLYYETPYYNYAVVIDYNRSPVRQGAGSAFFLHVSVGAPTAGCVSIEQSQLVRIMRWLRPHDHPRILIGTG